MKEITIIWNKLESLAMYINNNLIELVLRERKIQELMLQELKYRKQCTRIYVARNEV